MATKTRHKSATHMSDFLGSGREILVSELPTLRDVLRYGILLREQKEDMRHYLVKDMVKDILPVVKNQWLRANAMFKSPVIVSDQRIIARIEVAWNLANNIAQKKGVTKGKKEQFIGTLDRLFDILHCKNCPIQLCSEFNCSDCDKMAHTVCTCSRELKIPTLELAFIKNQREKIGSKGDYQIGKKDTHEHNRQVKAEKRELDKMTAEERRKKKRDDEIGEQAEALSVFNKEQEYQDNVESMVVDETDQAGDSDSSTYTEEELRAAASLIKKRQYNTMDISNVALTSVRQSF